MPAQKSDENAAIGPVGPIGSAKSNGLVRDRPLCRRIRKHCRCSRLTGSIAVVPQHLSVIFKFKGGSRSTAGTTGMLRFRPFVVLTLPTKCTPQNHLSAHGGDHRFKPLCIGSNSVA